MIKNVVIKGLFGEKKDVELIFKEKLTILIGGNGTGKTTILNLINSIINETYQNLFDYEFETILIQFKGKYLKIEKQGYRLELIEISEEKEFLGKKYILKDDGLDIDEELINSKIINSYYSKSLYFPTYRRAEVELTELFKSDKFRRNNFNFRLNNLNKFKNTVVGINNKDIADIVHRKWFEISQKESSILNSFISEMFLQSLTIKDNSTEILDSVDEENITSKIKEMYQRTLPIKENLLNSKLKIYREYITKAKQVNQELSRLLEGEPLEVKDINNILDSTMEQIDLKRNVDYSLSRILDIIELYEDKCLHIEKIKAPIKNIELTLSEFLYPKIAKIDKGQLYFLKNGDRLCFEDLSAGEKQIVTIFIYIVLVLDNKGIVLIDELELSLHIEWQRKIIAKLIENRPDVQFIISTHSPSILSNYRRNRIKMEEY